jgi:hypothetical protein
MPPIIPDDVPKLIDAGTTVRFHRSFGDFQASDGWAYTFYANGGSPPTKLAVPATTNADGQSFDIVIPADVTALTSPAVASLPAGRYTCSERVTNATLTPPEKHDPRGDDIQVKVEADVSTAAAGAFLSQMEQELAAINAVIAGRITADLQSYQITSGGGGGRSLVKIPITELYKIRGQLKNAVWRLGHPGELGPRVVIAFTNEAEEPTYPPTWVDVTGLDR